MSTELWVQMPDRQRETIEHWQKLKHAYPRSVLLTRHSIRVLQDAQGNSGYDLPLTDEGRALARRYGEWLRSEISFGSAISSTVDRCAETLSLMTDWQANRHDWLKEPGAFVDANPEVTARFFEAGHHVFARELLGDQLPTKHSVSEAAKRLLSRLFDEAQAGQPLLAVSHDSVLAVLFSLLSGEDLTSEQSWPQMMEGGVLLFDDPMSHPPGDSPDERLRNPASNSSIKSAIKPSINPADEPSTSQAHSGQLIFRGRIYRFSL